MSALIVRLLLVFACVGAAAIPANAAGMLVPRDGSPPLRVESHRVTAVVEDGLARTTLRQTFVNPYDRALEAVYVFPLPEGAALVDLVLENGGQRLEGLLAERRTARRAYDTIVRRNLDPALVEQIGKSTFRLSVFPVLPRQPTVVELTWIQQVPLTRGEYRWVYPLAGDGQAATTEKDFTLSVTFRSSAPLASVASPLDGVATSLVSPHEARASYERSGATLDRDVVVAARVAAREPSLAVRSFRGAKGDPFFSVVVTPPDAREEEILARDVTLVLDASGSMEGQKIEQAKASALWLLGNLRAKDRVNVLTFANEVRAFADRPVAPDDANLAKLRAFVDAVVAQGGTALGDGLAAAAAMPVEAGRVPMVVLLTDGQPTVGETSPAAIVQFAKSGADRGVRVHTFGVGSDVDATLLSGIAQAGRGTSQSFRPNGEIESRLSDFLTRTSAPVLANLRLEIDGRPVADLLPRPLPDVYLGEQAVLTGRAPLDGAHTFVVRGTANGREFVLVREAAFPKDPGGAPAVRDLYARSKLDFLESAHRLRLGLRDDAYYAALDRGAYSTADEIVRAMIDLSLETGVQCAYTSFLALLPEDRARLDPRDSAALDAALQRANGKRRELARLPARPEAPPTASAPEPERPADAPPAPEETKPFEESARVVEDPVLKDAKLEDHNETAGDLPDEESLGDPWFSSDSPFEGPGTGGTIGIGGGAGGAFGGRRGGHRILRAGGGGKKTQTAVDLGLEWLKEHQSPDGRWDADGFHAQCRKNVCSGPGAADLDPGVTGLALLCYLGAGETHQSGNYKDTVKNGLKYLRSIQDADGCFGPRTGARWMFDHMAACLAMTEAYGLTQSVLWKDSAQRGVNFLLQCRNPGRAWGPGVREGADDMAVTAWAAMCLYSAQLAELEVDRTAFECAYAWVETVTDPATGAVGARRRGEVPAAGAAPVPGHTAGALTAAGVLTRILCRAARGDTDRAGDPMIAKGAELLLSGPPISGDADGIEEAHWYLGSLAMFQIGDDAWTRWNTVMQASIVDRMVRDDRDERGSWDPAGPWAREGGRIAATAFRQLCLEVYYRYGRVFGTK